MFCGNCKTLMRPRGAEDQSTKFECPRCGSIELRKIDSNAVPFSLRSIDEKKPNGIAIISDLTSHVKHYCSKCGNDTATCTEIAPSRANDEQTEYIFKCTTCKSVERERSTGTD